MPSFKCLPGIRPIWLSRFLGHKNQTIAISVLCLAGALASWNWKNLFLVAGCLFGLWLSPDLDLSWTRLGLFGKLGFADEYTQLVKHRAKISHTPVIGTAVRVLVVLVPFGLIVFGVTGWVVSWGIVFRAFWGLVIADTWHIVMDQLSSHVFPNTRSVRRGYR